MENQVENAALLLMLAGAAYEDFREKKIHILIPLGAAAVGIVFHFLWRERPPEDVLLGMAIGLGVLFLSVLSRGSVGIGDGMVLTVSGIFLGFWDNLMLFLAALGIAGVAALFLIIIKRKRRNYRMPFLPFLLAAYLLWLL